MDAIFAGLITTAIFTALRVRVEGQPVLVALRETLPLVAAVVVGIIGGRWLDDQIFGGTRVVAIVGLVVVVATWAGSACAASRMLPSGDLATGDLDGPIRLLILGDEHAAARIALEHRNLSIAPVIWTIRLDVQSGRPTSPWM